MGLETNPQYISQLDASWPLGVDSQAEGDDHIRNIKQVLKTQFPNLGAAVVLPSAVEIAKVRSGDIPEKPNP